MAVVAASAYRAGMTALICLAMPDGAQLSGATTQLLYRRQRAQELSMLQIFSIGEDFHPKYVDGKLLRTAVHESVFGAYTYDFKIDKGRLSITVLNGKLHEVTYDCRAYFPWTRKRNNKYLLQAYSRDGAWRQEVRNEFGRIFRSENDIYYAMWCRKTRAVSFGTVFFHEQKYRINE